MKCYISSIAIVLLLVFTNFSCGKKQRENELQKLVTPIWNEKDIEATKWEGPMLTYKQELRIKPPFYRGPMPLRFIIAGKGYFGPFVSEMIPIYHDFGRFRNNFILKGGFVEGARTIDDSGFLLAEAKFVHFVKGESNQIKGIEIEEYHYGSDGKLRFKCKSLIVPQFGSLGFKKSETEAIGKKKRDYYFVWPY